MTLTALLLGALIVLVAGTMYFVFASFVFGAGYQPTPRRSVEAMLELARVGAGDTVIDLGAGTGAVVFRAAERLGARVVAVEVEPLRVLILRLRRRLSPARDRITIVWGDLFRRDFRDASVVALFLWPGAMERLRPILDAQLRPGARVVSHYHPFVGAQPTANDPGTKVFLYRWPLEPAPGTGT